MNYLYLAAAIGGATVSRFEDTAVYYEGLKRMKANRAKWDKYARKIKSWEDSATL